MTKILAVEYPATQFTPGGSLPVIFSGGTVVADADVDTILARAKRWGVRVHEVTAQDILTIPSDPVPGPVVSGGGVSQSDLDAAVALLQDKATAATDTELANAVTTLNSALAAKQDASSAATDAEVATLLASKQDVVGNPGSVIASAIFSGAVGLTNAFVAVPNWQIVVPANSGPIDLAVPEGMLFNIVTGTYAAGTRFTLYGRITDETGAVVAYSGVAINSTTAATQTWVIMLPLRKIVPNNPAAKTYKVELLMDKAGVNGSSSVMFNSSQGAYPDPTLTAVRR